MNDLKRESILDSIREVKGKIAQVDENLAGLFEGVAEVILMAEDKKREKGSSEPIDSKDIQGIIRGNLAGGINTVPFGVPKDECFKMCLVIAFGLINSKYGFNKIAVNMKDCWLRCKEVNCGTLIITNAWDNPDFYRRYKESFDTFSSSKNRNNVKHTVAIVLYGDYGFSIQYSE